MAMNNKQVIAIFIVGIALLLGAFWAGLSVIKQDSAKGNSAPVDRVDPKPAESRPSPSAETRYIVFVAAFGTLEKAKQLEADLHERKYLAAYVNMPQGKEDLYRV